MELKPKQIQLHKSRNSSFEVLRLIAMTIIIFHHFVVHGIIPVVDIWQNHSMGILISILMGWGGYLGNSLFILLTGYFSVNQKFSVKRLVILLGTMVFYSLAIAMICNSQHRLSMKAMIPALFPFLFGYNWFVACYLMFMPLTPYINKLLRQLTKMQYLWLVVMEYFLYCIVPVFRGNSFSNAYMLQFVMVYCIGGYLKLYGFKNEKLNKTGTWIVVILVLGILTNVAVALQWLIGYRDIWRSVNFLSTGIAVGMFMVATCHKPFYSFKINKLAGSVLGVYLIHDNPLVRPFLWLELVPNVEFLNKWYFMGFMFVKVIVVYAVCLVIDLARRKWLEPLFRQWVEQHWNDWCSRGRKFRDRAKAQIANL